MRTAWTLLAAAGFFFALDSLIFRSGFYTPYLNPDSSSGHMELVLNNEIHRDKSDRNQVLTVGDSRMGFFPRYVNGRPEIGYTFGTVASAGTTPRCWPYLVRAVDPTRHAYRAIVVPLEDFDDDAGEENTSEREIDLRFVVARLGWRDLWDFAGSFPEWNLREHAALGIAFKGAAYSADFQDFLRAPSARLDFAKLMRNGSPVWFRDYRGPDKNVAGMQIDWQKRTLVPPPGMDDAVIDRFRGRLFSPIAAAPAWRTEYLKRWLGAICDAYRGTGTKIIFIRLPRGPYPRPDMPPPDPNSSVHQLAREPHVILDSEHTFDALEDPTLFMDPLHFNGPGEERFATMLARRVRELLGPPSTN